jgi:opacity protein-like surface antigen
MRKDILVLTASAFILACSAIAASAQQVPDVPPTTLQQHRERQLQGTQTPRRDSDDLDDDGWRGYGSGWRHYQDWDRGPRIMGRGGIGPGNMASGMMMRMLFTLMDSDGDGTVSLQEFQAAHERIFKAMDANKDGRLTLEEIQSFVQGIRRSVPQQ